MGQEVIPHHEVTRNEHIRRCRNDDVHLWDHFDCHVFCEKEFFEEEIKVNEGGRVFPTSMPVSLGQYAKFIRTELYEFLRKYDLDNFHGIGSTGKAPTMQDVDLACESELTRNEVYDKLVQDLGTEKVKKVGSIGLSLLYNDEIQVDVFIGDIRYLRWSRASCSYRNGYGLLKGAFRNMLLNSTLRVQSSKEFKSEDPLLRTRRTLDFDTGFYLVKQTKHGKTVELKDWKTTDREFITNVPDDIVYAILGNDGWQWKSRYVRSVEELVPLLKRSIKTRDYAQEIFEEFMKDVNSLDRSVKMFGKQPDLVLDLLQNVIDNKDV